VREQPTSEWYKDEGGKGNVLRFVVSAPVAERVKLNVELRYEDGYAVEDAGETLAIATSAAALYLTPERPEALIEFRIEKVSRRKDGRHFCLHVEPEYAASSRVPPEVRLTGVTSEPINVMSKRKTGFRDVTRRQPRPVVDAPEDMAGAAYKALHGTLLQMQTTLDEVKALAKRTAQRQQEILTVLANAGQSLRSGSAGDAAAAGVAVARADSLSGGGAAAEAYNGAGHTAPSSSSTAWLFPGSTAAGSAATVPVSSSSSSSNGAGGRSLRSRQTPIVAEAADTSSHLGGPRAAGVGSSDPAAAAPAPPPALLRGLVSSYSMGGGADQGGTAPDATYSAASVASGGGSQQQQQQLLLTMSMPPESLNLSGIGAKRGFHSLDGSSAASASAAAAEAASLGFPLLPPPGANRQLSRLVSMDGSNIGSFMGSLMGGGGPADLADSGLVYLPGVGASLEQPRAQPRLR